VLKTGAMAFFMCWEAGGIGGGRYQGIWCQVYQIRVGVSGVADRMD